MELAGLFIVGFGCSDLVGEVSDVIYFVVVLNCCNPFFPNSVPVDALIPGGPISRKFIATVLGWRTQAKVAPGVVEAVMVDMVDE